MRQIPDSVDAVFTQQDIRPGAIEPLLLLLTGWQDMVPALQLPTTCMQPRSVHLNSIDFANLRILSSINPTGIPCDRSVIASLQLLEEDSPGKVGGPPGDAFDVVYTVVANAVREKMHNVDPVLAEYIRFVVNLAPCTCVNPKVAIQHMCGIRDPHMAVCAAIL